MGERTQALRGRIAAREALSSTFIKTSDVSVIELMSTSGLDFLILDAEHAPFGRREMDVCLAMGRALDMPILVRVLAAREDAILAALDAGAVGVVVPHVDSVENARAVAAAAHFGRGGRGYAGSTRWAGFATRPMGDVLAQDDQTIVIAQIEEPEGVDAVAQIAAVDGIDALFAGPADLSVGYGQSVVGTPALDAALTKINAACDASGKAFVTWVPDVAKAQEWAKFGVNIFVVASEQTWIRNAAVDVARGIKDIARG